MGQTATIGTHRTTVTNRLLPADPRSTAKVVVTYHNTEVAIIGTKSIILNSGGWRTVTTKARMNQASNQYNLGYRVYQKDHVWYVDFKGKTIEFSDAMVLTR